MNDNFTNEFFGIGIQNGKTPENLGVLWRSAQNLGASFIFTIGNRYAKQACDTHNAVKAMPYFHKCITFILLPKIFIKDTLGGDIPDSMLLRFFFLFG